MMLNEAHFWVATAQQVTRSKSIWLYLEGCGVIYCLDKLECIAQHGNCQADSEDDEDSEDNEDSEDDEDSKDNEDSEGDWPCMPILYPLY